jgi:hypothetical protein
MTRCLGLALVCVSILGTPARSEVPALQLSFSPDSHMAAASIDSHTVFHVYVRNVGSPYDFKYIAFDISRLPFGSPLTVLTVSGAPQLPACDFPPWNSCIGANCANVSDYPILIDATFFGVQAIAHDTVLCIEPPTNSYVTPLNIPVYLDCDLVEHPLAVSGSSPSPGGLGCIVINPSPVPIEGATWSAIKSLY